MSDYGPIQRCVHCSWEGDKIYKVDPKCPVHGSAAMDAAAGPQHVDASGDFEATRRVFPTPKKKDGHYYPGCQDPANLFISSCAYGCGAWVGPTHSGAPNGIDPFGDCPKAPKLEESRQRHRAMWKAIDKERATLVEKNAALREALEYIASGEGAYGWQAHEYKQIARAALKETSDER